MELALKAKQIPVSSLPIVPPLIQPGAPNFAVIQKAVRKKIEAAEAADAPPPPSASPVAGASPTAKAKKKKPTTKLKPTDDLSKVCAA